MLSINNIIYHKLYCVQANNFRVGKKTLSQMENLNKMMDIDLLNDNFVNYKKRMKKMKLEN